MYITVTDILTCPRCGPDWGLIVLADRLEARQVVEGRLGCANCRGEYPIQGGTADLRLAEGGDAGAGPVEDDAERAFRTAALLGVGEHPGRVVVAGAAPAFVRRVAELLPNASVIGASRARPDPAEGPMDWIVYRDALPVRTGSLRALAVVGGAGPGELAEAARALAPHARLVLDPATEEELQELSENGFQTLLHQEGVAVASAGGQG